jgi:glutamate carboxypeptidase
MRTPTERELLAGIEAWVAVESPTREIAGVERAMALAERELAAAGARTRRIPGSRGLAHHLEAASAWGGDGPGILVLSHLDTVHPVGTLARFPFRVEGDRAYGPGIYDMKGGAYIALAAFRSLAQAGVRPPLPVRFLIVSDEEIGSPTSRALIEEAGRKAKYVLVTEPSRDGGKVVTARKGTGRFTITAHGRPAHSGSRPEDGRSAIGEIARQVLDIEKLADRARGITTNVGLIRGGTAANVVPAECAIEVDFRVATTADAEHMVRTLGSRTPHNRDVRLVIEGRLNRPPFEKTPAIDALFERARQIAAGIGFALEDCSTGGGSDGNFLAARIATLDGLGVDGAGAHTLEEHLLVSSLVPRLRLLRGLMETLD